MWKKKPSPVVAETLPKMGIREIQSIVSRLSFADPYGEAVFSVTEEATQLTWRVTRPTVDTRNWNRSRNCMKDPKDWVDSNNLLEYESHTNWPKNKEEVLQCIAWLTCSLAIHETLEWLWDGEKEKLIYDPHDQARSIILQLGTTSGPV